MIAGEGRPLNDRVFGKLFAFNSDGTLTYTFVESVKATFPYYVIRLAGGVLYLGGMLLMAYNVWKTLAAGQAVNDARIPQAVAA